MGLMVTVRNNLVSDLLENYQGQPALSRLMVVPKLFHLLMTQWSVERGSEKEWDNCE